LVLAKDKVTHCKLW